MVTGAFRELFVAVATAAASLTGLLFVVITVTERGTRRLPTVVQEVRAAAALLSFTDALAVALFGLVPGTLVGYPAAIVAVVGLFFSAAAMRSFLAPAAGGRAVARHLVLTLLLLAAFIAQLFEGIELVAHPHSSGSLETLSYILVAMLLVGIARAWELAGGRNTGILGSLGVLLGRGSDTATVTATDPTPGDAGTGTRTQGDTADR